MQRPAGAAATASGAVLSLLPFRRALRILFSQRTERSHCSMFPKSQRDTPRTHHTVRENQKRRHSPGPAPLRHAAAIPLSPSDCCDPACAPHRSITLQHTYVDPLFLRSSSCARAVRCDCRVSSRVSAPNLRPMARRRAAQPAVRGGCTVRMGGEQVRCTTVHCAVSPLATITAEDRCALTPLLFVCVCACPTSVSAHCTLTHSHLRPRTPSACGVAVQQRDRWRRCWPGARTRRPFAR